MMIEFFNLKKVKVPFLINVKEQDYHLNLSKNSKRHYNKSYNKWKQNTHVFFDNKMFIELFEEDLINHFDLNIYKLIDMRSLDNIYYLKITDKKFNLLAFNIYYVTNKIKYVYSLCPYIKIKDYTLNNFLWYETINYFLKSSVEKLDIEYEYNLNIKSNEKYDVQDIFTFQDVLNNRVKTVGFDDENSSKFLFLTVDEKQKMDMYYLMYVCSCGQKNLININQNNICVGCDEQITKIYD